MNPNTVLAVFKNAPFQKKAMIIRFFQPVLSAGLREAVLVMDLRTAEAKMLRLE